MIPPSLPLSTIPTRKTRKTLKALCSYYGEVIFRLLLQHTHTATLKWLSFRQTGYDYFHPSQCTTTPKPPLCMIDG